MTAASDSEKLSIFTFKKQFSLDRINAPHAVVILFLYQLTFIESKIITGNTALREAIRTQMYGKYGM